jgi:hypothetical protein
MPRDFRRSVSVGSFPRRRSGDLSLVVSTITLVILQRSEWERVEA